MEFIKDPQNFDQHFLIDDKIINEFINVANVLPTDEVLEIGPGEGVLTKLIAKKAKKVTCVELDQRLKLALEEIVKKNNNVEIIYGNALDVYLPKCDKIITSLPYRIIEPFIHKLLKCEFNELFMIVGNRFAEGVLNKEKNKLSVLTNSFFRITKFIEILPDSFNPPPRVKSALIKLEPIGYFDLDDEYLMFRLLFNFREKKVKNNLQESLIKFFDFKNYKLTKKESKKIIENINLNEKLLNKTFETCTNEDFKELSFIFQNLQELLHKTKDENSQ